MANSKHVISDEIETDRRGLSSDEMCSMTPSEMRQIVGGAVPTHRVIGNTLYSGPSLDNSRAGFEIHGFINTD